MDPETDKLEDLCQTLSTNTLKSFAEKRSISLAEDSTRTDIINRIVEETQDETKRLSSTVFRLELEGSNQLLLSETMKALDAAVGTLNEEQKRTLSEVNQRNDQHFKATDQMVSTTKWGLAATIAALSLIISLAGFLGYNKINEIEQAKMDLDAIVKEHRVLVASSRELVLKEIAQDIGILLDSMSISLLKREELAEASSYKQATEQILQSLNPADSDSQHYRIAKLLGDVLDGILATREVNEGHSKKAYQVLEDKWLNIDSDQKFESAVFESFVRNLDSQKHNMLGTVSLKRYQKFEDKIHIQNAEQYFQKAIENRPSLARAHINLGNVWLYRFQELSKEGGSRKDLLSLLQRSENKYREALAYVVSNESVFSSTQNNLANAKLKRAKLIANHNPQMAETLVKETIEILEDAKNRLGASPVILITLAETRALSLELSKDSIANWASEEKAREYEQIILLLERSIESGYTGLDVYNQSQVLAKLPALQSLRYLNTDYERDILSALGKL